MENSATDYVSPAIESRTQVVALLGNGGGYGSEVA